MKNLQFVIAAALVFSIGCTGKESERSAELVEQPAESALYNFAGTCVAVSSADSGWLKATDEGAGFHFTAVSAIDAAHFVMRASDLGTYLFLDETEGYLVSETAALERRTSLDSDVYLIDDSYVSGAEWHLHLSETVSNSFVLQNRKTERYLGLEGLVDSAEDAASLKFRPTDGCAEFPEMTLDASGEVGRTLYEDGDLFGFVDTHSHILSNFGFGGGGIFHGAAFHRLGVEHAMGSCEPFHAEEGRADMLGSGFSGGTGLDQDSLVALLSTGRLPEFAHDTDGWPTFSDWPSYRSATHQVQYYKWLERAWLSGLRLVVQHAVSNEAFCDLMAKPGFQPVRYTCRDMDNVDRQLKEVRNLERYIDAQSGGPGEGWFRIVETPAAARKVIREGKLAVILGIEVPNLFSCYLTPGEDDPECSDEYINEQLDLYREKGIRVLFSNHKYDNRFTPGDGHRGIVELGNFVTTGHWSNYTEDCPDISSVFDKGSVQFGGLNEPRDMHIAMAPNEPVDFSDQPLKDLLPYLSRVQAPRLEGDWCQALGMTAPGRTLIQGIMERGMIPEIDHLPRRSYADVFAMLEAANYPAAGTHGVNNGGKLYELGGVSKSGFGRCADPVEPGSMAARFRSRKAQLVAAGAYPAEGFGFDLNGLAGVPRPRFGDDSNCEEVQENPVEYPFISYAGDVTFQRPSIGERIVDFNTEGMIHIGLVPELIEDARRTGVSDEDLDILFRSAEGYIRMWELAEERSQDL